MKPVYLAGVDAVSRQRFARRFVELAAEEQDEVLAALEPGHAGGWPAGDSTVPPAKVFEAVRFHTIGFLADPKDGGHLEYAGVWAKKRTPAYGGKRSGGRGGSDPSGAFHSRSYFVY